MSSLLVADDSLMMVIDAQTAFLDKLPAAVGGQLLSRICWLTQLAIWRHVPLLVTAEDLASQPVAPALCQVLPHDLPV